MSTLTLMPPGTVDESTAENLNSIFVPIAEKARALIVKGSVLTITDPTEVSKMKLARTMRLELKDIRVDLEKRRKALKDESLRKGQAIDSAAATIRVLIEDCEQHLLEQEKFAENIEKTRISEMVQRRTSELHALEVNPANFNLYEMSEDDYDELWTNSSRAKRQREEAANKAEAERLARVKAEQEEQERIRAENARLKAEADAREAVAKKEREEAAKKLRAEQEKARKEREAAALAAEAQRAEQEAKLAAEKAKHDAEMKRIKDEADAKTTKAKAAADKAAKEAAEEARKLREKFEAQQKHDREERERIEAERKEAQRVKDAEEAARLKAFEDAAKAPDKEKLKSFADSLYKLDAGDLSTGEGRQVWGVIEVELKKLARWITERSDKL